MRYLLVLSVLFAVASALSLAGKPALAGEQLRIGGTGASLQYSRTMALAFSEVSPATEVTVYEGLGSSGSIRAVIAGALDVAISGRPLKESETGNGLSVRPLLATPFGFFTSRREPVAIDSGDVAEVFGQAGGPSPWFGGETVRVVLRPHADSDPALAAEYFAGFAESIEAVRQRPGIPVAQTDQDNARIAQEMENSLATGTLLQMVSEGRDLRPVRIDGVMPSVETMRSGRYRFTKTLYLVHRQAAGSSARRFAEYLRSDEAVRTTARLGAVVIR